MTVPLPVSAPPGAAPVPPQHWTAPAEPHGDPGSVRAAAAAMRAMADQVRASRAVSVAAMDDLAANWVGAGQRASAHPVAVLSADCERVAAGLEELAAGLDRYAAALEHAQRAHRFTWGRLLKVGAVVVVSAGLVVVTAGAATAGVAAAGAAIIGTEVGGLAVASGSAAAAATSSATTLLMAARAVAALRGLAAALRPGLPWAIGMTGIDAAHEQWTADHLDVRHLAAELGLGLALPPSLTRASEVVRGAAPLAARPVAGAVTGHLAAGGVVGAGEAVRQVLEGERVRLGPVAAASGEGAGLSAGAGVLRDVAPAAGERSGTAVGIIGQWRQSVLEALTEPLELARHEGGQLGHTIEKHVDKSLNYLRGRMVTQKGRKSTFFTEQLANETTERVLREHADEVRAWAAGNESSYVITGRVKGHEGIVLERDGVTRTVPSTIIIRMSRFEGHPFIKTSYLG